MCFTPTSGVKYNELTLLTTGDFSRHFAHRPLQKNLTTFFPIFQRPKSNGKKLVIPQRFLFTKPSGKWFQFFPTFVQEDAGELSSDKNSAFLRKNRGWNPTQFYGDFNETILRIPQAELIRNSWFMSAKGWVRCCCSVGVRSFHLRVEFVAVAPLAFLVFTWKSPQENRHFSIKQIPATSQKFISIPFPNGGIISFKTKFNLPPPFYQRFLLFI